MGLLVTITYTRMPVYLGIVLDRTVSFVNEYAEYSYQGQ